MSSAGRRALVLPLAALLLILPALLLGGCGDSDGDDETTTSTTTEETSTTTGEGAGDSDVVTELQPPKDRETGGVRRGAFHPRGADTYEKMISIEDRAVFHNNLGNVLRDSDEIEEAKQEYREAISIDPDVVVAYVNLAAVLVSEDSVEEAIEVLSDGISEVEGEDRERLEDYMSQLRERLE